MLFRDLIEKAQRNRPARTEARSADAPAPAARGGREAKAPAHSSRSRAAFREEAHPRHPAGRPDGGRFAPKDFAERMRGAGLPADPMAPFDMRIRAPAGQRAFAGAQVATPKSKVLGGPGRQNEVGDRAEALALDYVRQHVSQAAVLLKQAGSKNNAPFDMAAHIPGRGIVLYEVKGGQPSNGRSAWQWRITFDYQMTAEQKKSLAKLSPEELRRRQQQEAGKRKKRMLEAIEGKLRENGTLAKGERVEVETVGVIFDAHRGVADIHVMPDVTDRTGWTSERAAQGYRGSFTFVQKMGVAEAIRTWGDALEADLMRQVPDIVRRIGALVPKPKPEPAATVVKMHLDVAKADEDMRYFAGWASIIEKDGKVVVDTQGDIVDEPTLVEAAHGFMRDHRVGKTRHRGAADKVEYVESIVFTHEVQKALGVDLGKVGWWLAGYARDDDTWGKVKKGDLPALSIGGVADREPTDIPA